MTYKPKRLFVVVGLACFLLVGVMLPLCTARAAGLPFVEARLPAAAVFTTALPTLTPTMTPVPAQVPTPTFTTEPDEATLTPTLTSPPPIPMPTDTPTASAAPTDTSLPTFTPAPTKEPSPTDTAAPTETRAPTVVPTALPTLTATPLGGLPLPPEIAGVLGERWPLVIGGCVVVLLAVLVLVLLLMVFRRKKKPKPPPSPPRSYEAVPEAYLESVDTVGGPRHFPLKPGGVTIGRAPDNEVVITQDFAGWDTISRKHARIFQREGQWIVDDLDSKNGVWVNGRRTGHNLLKDGWELRIGKVVFIFRAGPGEASQ